MQTPKTFTMRPLLMMGDEARKLGFLLEWQDAHVLHNRQGEELRKLMVRLTPQTDEALAALVNASGDVELVTITAHTNYVEGQDDLFDVARDTARSALDTAIEVLQ